MVGYIYPDAAPIPGAFELGFLPSGGAASAFLAYRFPGLTDVGCTHKPGFSEETWFVAPKAGRVCTALDWRRGGGIPLARCGSGLANVGCAPEPIEDVAGYRACLAQSCPVASWAREEEQPLAVQEVHARQVDDDDEHGVPLDAQGTPLGPGQGPQQRDADQDQAQHTDHGKAR